MTLKFEDVAVVSEEPMVTVLRKTKGTKAIKVQPYSEKPSIRLASVLIVTQPM